MKKDYGPFTWLTSVVLSTLFHSARFYLQGIAIALSTLALQYSGYKANECCSKVDNFSLLLPVQQRTGRPFSPPTTHNPLKRF
jgi:hypothetical protein